MIIGHHAFTLARGEPVFRDGDRHSERRTWLASIMDVDML
jgi:hypothetical protein